VAPCGSCVNLRSRSTRCHIPEDDILHSHSRQNLKYYNLNIFSFISCTENFMCLTVYEMYLTHPLMRLHVLYLRFSHGPVVCDKTPCSPLKVDRCFGGTYRLHFEAWRISQARKPPGSRQQEEPCQLIFNGLHGVISQKIELLPYLV
jgi:hypothetical protein